jgi:hypothetical protein
MADAQVRNHDVKFGDIERKVLRIRLDKGRVPHSVARKRQHGRGKIDTDDPAAAAYQRRGDVALPTTQVECFEVGFGADRIQQTFDRLIRRRRE